MGIIRFDNLKPGMVLEENVFDSKGRLLLGKGTPLNETHLKVFASRGIVDVAIQDVTEKVLFEESKAEIDSSVYNQAVKETREHFQHTNVDQEAISELIQLCTLRRAKQLQSVPSGIDTQTLSATLIQQAQSRKLNHVTPGSLVKDENLELPSLPVIYHQIKEAIDKPGSSALQISNVISNDTSLSAKLLRLVNSAFYGVSSKVEDLTRAVTMVGTAQIGTLALGITVLSVFKNIPLELIHMKSFWEHSVACGIAARKLAELKQLESQERYFIAGLLHDIGRLIVYQAIPEHGREALLTARLSRKLLYETEKEILGFEHADVGGRALKKWKLPPALQIAVRLHHSPRQSGVLLEPAIIHIADILTNAGRFGSSGECFVPPLAPGIWAAVGLPVNVLGLTLGEVEQQLTAIVQFLFPDS